MRTQLPSPKRRRSPSPNFRPMSIEVKGLDGSRWHLTRRWASVQSPLGTQLPSPKRGQSPQFSAHFYCGQTAAWIKMALRVDVGLGPGDFVLDGDPAPSPSKRERSPQFSAHVYCGKTAVCIRIPLGTKVGLSLGDTVLDGDPAPLPPKRAEPLPNFWPMSIVAKRLDGSR